MAYQLARSYSLQETTWASAPYLRVRGHIPGLDGVRGLAIALVLFHHLWPWIWDGPVLSVVTRLHHLGWIGVDIFFVLSGFLITGILLDSRGRAGYWSNFIARCALRIFPLYFLFLVVAFAVLPGLLTLVGQPDPLLLENRKALPWFVTYMSNHIVLFDDLSVRSLLGTDGVAGVQGGIHESLAITWSLSVEEQFYLAWPLIVLLFGPVLPRAVAVMSLLAVASRLVGYTVAAVGFSGGDEPGVLMGSG